MNEEFIRYPNTYRTAQEAMVADLNKQLETITILRKQLEVAMKAVKYFAPESAYKDVKAEINRIGKIGK